MAFPTRNDKTNFSENSQDLFGSRLHNQAVLRGRSSLNESRKDLVLNFQNNCLIEEILDSHSSILQRSLAPGDESRSPIMAEVGRMRRLSLRMRIGFEANRCLSVYYGQHLDFHGEQLQAIESTRRSASTRPPNTLLVIVWLSHDE
jgi:hypothetical protein